MEFVPSQSAPSQKRGIPGATRPTLTDMRVLGLVSAGLLLASPTGGATADPRIPELSIARIDGGIVLDGQLSEPTWQEARRVEEWFETSPGDNVPPKVESVGYLAYDDRHVSVGFDFRDPEPQRIRSPLGDRDSVTGAMDHGGVHR